MRFLILAFLLVLSTPAYAADKESTFDRVIKTGTIRCGYGLWPPVLVQNPETKEFSGISYDILQEAAKRLSLKLEWVEEAGLDVILQGMQTDRYDMVCFPLYATASRARVAFFTDALYYAPIHVVTRESDTRFDKDFMLLNNTAYKIATLEGEMTAILATQRFPKSTPHAIPQTQGYSFVLKDVGLGKADATISDPTTISDYNKNNEEKLKILQPPFTVNGVAYPIAQDIRFKEMLDTTLTEMMTEGWINTLIRTKYPYYWANILPVATPFGSATTP